MKKLAIIFLLLSSYAPIVIGVNVYGDLSCGTLLENHKRDNQEYELNKSWIVGVLSGMNLSAYLNKEKQVILNDGIDAVYYAIKYCKDNPLDPVIDALGVLMFESLYD